MTAPPHDVIFETIITTVSPLGHPHVAPMGARYAGTDDATVYLWPFAGSATLDNIRAGGRAVLNTVADSRIFAGCVTGRRRDWPVVPVADGVRLQAALWHAELRLREDDGDFQRPLLRLERTAEGCHGRYLGLSRAQAAVVEGAVLVSRLHLLPTDTVVRELARLQTAIDKTASPDDREAWRWLQAAVAEAVASTPPNPAASTGP